MGLQPPGLPKPLFCAVPWPLLMCQCLPMLGFGDPIPVEHHPSPRTASNQINHDHSDPLLLHIIYEIPAWLQISMLDEHLKRLACASMDANFEHHLARYAWFLRSWGQADSLLPPCLINSCVINCPRPK
ncbi:hypothetical protein GQ53DRAFT_751048 [Thozetella sp. PMI_491]|nr:hypothetical protein GQ53DRAFT_751048 [Thozetella sp. PMI_491]